MDFGAVLTTVIIGITFLYSMLGVSAFIGIACVPLSAPLSTWLAGRVYKCSKTLAARRDARVAAIKEFLNNYKIIKVSKACYAADSSLTRLKPIIYVIFGVCVRLKSSGNAGNTPLGLYLTSWQTNFQCLPFWSLL